jgi:hypothetical protein
MTECLINIAVAANYQLLAIFQKFTNKAKRISIVLEPAMSSLRKKNNNMKGKI